MEVTVFFYDVNNNISSEILLCDRLSSNTCKIKSIPLYASNLAIDDIIYFQREDNNIFFEELKTASKNSTIQIVELVDNSLKELLNKIENNINGKKFDFSGKYVAINVETEEDYLIIRHLLIEYEEKNLISFKEACLAF